MKKFHKLRPPGYGIDSNALQKALPTQIKRKIGRRTVIRRLGEKGYTAQKKLNKDDKGEKNKAGKIKFCKKFKAWKALQWQNHLQACGDLKDFTWYPKALQPRFKKLRAPWTYMNKRERKQSQFQRPKRWFVKKDYDLVKKQKVFGFTASNGAMLAFLTPKTWDSNVWARMIKSKLLPWLKKTFPGKTSFNILLDGEKLLHAKVAKTAFREAGISIVGPWPGYSPDLNPQENIWSSAEPALRRSETGRESFEEWKTKLVPRRDNGSCPERIGKPRSRRYRKN